MQSVDFKFSCGKLEGEFGELLIAELSLQTRFVTIVGLIT